jgi:hypothetical protein
LEFAKVKLPVAASVTNIILWVQTAGGTLTAGQNFSALFNSAGTLIGQSPDQAAAWAGTGLKTAALTGGPFVCTAGNYFVGFWYNGTTAPTMGRSGSAGSVIYNAGTAAPNLICGSADTGLTTTAPSPMGAQTATASPWWVALS